MLTSPVHEIPPTKGAAVESWIDSVSKNLLSYQPHVVSIAHDFMPSREYKEGVYYHRIHIGRVYKRVFQKILGFDFYSYNKRVFHIIQKVRPDIIHIHNYHGAGEIVGRIRGFDAKIKIVLHMHNISESFQKKPFPKVDVFLGCSRYITDYYAKNRLIKADKFIPIYNGVDTEKFRAALNKKGKLKDFLGDCSQKNIFYIGRISEEKGVDKIVEIARLLQCDENYRFYLFGEISNSGERKRFYQRLCDEIKAQSLKNITFFDYVAPQKMHYIYQMADCVIVPSRFEEPFCMVAIEAMASGIPTVCAYKGGMKEYLEDEKNAMVIYDYDDFAKQGKEKIQRLFEDGALKERIITHAEAMVRENYDWLDIAVKLEAIYKNL